MCNTPVTLGGGITMVYGSRSSGTERKYFFANQWLYHLFSVAFGSHVFATLVVGVAKVGDFKSIGRIGIKTILYFQFATLLALALGLILVNVFEPGHVMHLPVPPDTATSGVASKMPTLKDFITHVIP